MRYILAFIAVVFLSFAARAYDIFTVEGLAVEASGESAKLARNKAIRQGERTAFYKVAKRVAVRVSESALTEFSGQDISAMVQGMEVIKEKLTPSHYRAQVNISFNPRMVRDALQEVGVSSLVQKRKPTLVLAVMRQDGEVLGWYEAHIWKKLWQDLAKESRFIPLRVVNDGGEEDYERLYRWRGKINEDEFLREVVGRYGGDSVMLVEVDSDKKGRSIEAKVALFEASGVLRFTRSVDKAKDAGQAMGDVAADVVRHLEKQWKRRQLAAGGSSKLEVVVPIDDINDWRSKVKKIRSLASVRRVEIREISVEQGAIDIYLSANYAEFDRGLANIGMHLSNGGDRYVLRKSIGFSNSDWFDSEEEGWF